MGKSKAIIICQKCGKAHDYDSTTWKFEDKILKPICVKCEFDEKQKKVLYNILDIES